MGDMANQVKQEVSQARILKSLLYSVTLCKEKLMFENF